MRKSFPGLRPNRFSHFRWINFRGGSQVGEGIFAGLDRFDVTLAPEATPQVLRGHREDFRPTEWTMCDVSFDAEYGAAVLVELPEVELTANEWSPH